MIVRYHEPPHIQERFSDCLILLEYEDHIAPVYLPRTRVRLASVGAATILGSYRVEERDFCLQFSGVFGNFGRPIPVACPTWDTGICVEDASAFEDLYWYAEDIDLRMQQSVFSDPTFRANQKFAEKWVEEHCDADLTNYRIRTAYYANRREFLDRERDLRTGENGNLFTSGRFRDSSRFVIT